MGATLSNARTGGDVGGSSESSLHRPPQPPPPAARTGGDVGGSSEPSLPRPPQPPPPATAIPSSAVSAILCMHKTFNDERQRKRPAFDSEEIETVRNQQTPQKVSLYCL